MMLPDLLSVFIGFCAGVLSGMLGIGGGMVMVPAMVLALHVPQHTAQAVSLSVIAVSASTGTIAHWRYGNVVWSIALRIAPVAAVFAVVIVVLGIRMLLLKR